MHWQLKKYRTQTYPFKLLCFLCQHTQVTLEIKGPAHCLELPATAFYWTDNVKIWNSFFKTTSRGFWFWNCTQNAKFKKNHWTWKAEWIIKYASCVLCSQSELLPSGRKYRHCIWESSRFLNWGKSDTTRLFCVVPRFQNHFQKLMTGLQGC